MLNAEFKGMELSGTIVGKCLKMNPRVIKSTREGLVIPEEAIADSF